MYAEIADNLFNEIQKPASEVLSLLKHYEYMSNLNNILKERFVFLCFETIKNFKQFLKV